MRWLVIRFTPEQARCIRGKRWHPTQKLKEQDDGSLILQMQVGGLGEVKRLVLQYCASAEVLATPDLRQMVADEAARLTSRYHAGAGPQQRGEKHL